MTVPSFKYHIVDRNGDHKESNIPTLAQAQEALELLKLSEPHCAYHIATEQIYTTTGLGRDPDLY